MSSESPVAGGADTAGAVREATARAAVVLDVQDVGKMYRLFDRPQDRLKEQLLWRVGRRYGREFWALREVSFQVRRGERFGVIGRNGAGKSTLLQLIAGILAPTNGTVRVHGRLSALLELGAGFNLEFTGRENARINAAIMGLDERQIDERLDAILAFADIGRFVDQPAKVYSSGMLIRLAFSVATHVDADVVLIDEALAVGDVFFRQRCYDRLERLLDAGASVVLVSHNATEVQQFCQRTLLLHEGRPLFIGPSPEAVSRYYLLEQAPAGGASEPGRHQAGAPGRPASPGDEKRRGAGDEPADEGRPPAEAFLRLDDAAQVSDGRARCTAVALCDGAGRPSRFFVQGSTAVFWYEFEALAELDVPILGLVIRNEKSIVVHGKSTLEHGTAVPRRVPAGARIRCRQAVELQLAVGEYTFQVGLATIADADYARAPRAEHSALTASTRRACQVVPAGDFAIVLRPPTAPVQLLHHGVANLPGSCRVTVAGGARSGGDPLSSGARRGEAVPGVS